MVADLAFELDLAQTAGVTLVDPMPGSVPVPVPPVRRKTCACKKKRGKGGPILMAGSAFLVGYGLALLAGR